MNPAGSTKNQPQQNQGEQPQRLLISWLDPTAVTSHPDNDGFLYAVDLNYIKNHILNRQMPEIRY